MIHNGLKIGGAIVFWSLPEYFFRSALLAGWEQLGYARFVPPPRPHAASLKDALCTVVGARTRLVRPLKNRDGFQVTEETAGEDTNSYEHYLSAKITGKPDDAKVRLAFDPFRDEEVQKILDQFNTYASYVTNAQVATSLVALLGHLGATTLRPGGALYWCPDFSLDHLGRAAQVVESSATRGKCAVYVMRNVMDGDAVRAVRDAIVKEVTDEVERLDKEVLQGELGSRALENRKNQVAELRLKVKEYEGILGCGLADLTRATEATEEIICKAEVLASAGSEVAV